MKLFDFFMMLVYLFVGIMCITGLVLLITYWRFVAGLLEAIFVRNYGVWSSALVISFLVGFAFSVWATRRIRKSGSTWRP